jgi:hypothetical protein
VFTIHVKYFFVVLAVPFDDEGCAIAQAVSRQLLTAENRVRTRDWSCGICGGQSGTGEGFLLVFLFSSQFALHRLAHNHHHYLSSGAGTIGQTVAAVPSGLSLTSREKNMIMASSDQNM